MDIDLGERLKAFNKVKNIHIIISVVRLCFQNCYGSHEIEIVLPFAVDCSRSQDVLEGKMLCNRWGSYMSRTRLGTCDGS